MAQLPNAISLRRKRAPYTQRSGKQIRAALNRSPEDVQKAVMIVVAKARREIKSGQSGNNSDWEFESAFLAVDIARLTIGAGAAPKRRLRQRVLEILVEQTTQMNHFELDRRVAMRLAGMLLGFLPNRRGRPDTGRDSMQRASGASAAPRVITTTALRLRANVKTDALALWEALREHGEDPRLVPRQRFLNLLRRISDARRRK